MDLHLHLWEAAATAALPLFLALLIQTRWSAQAKRWVAAGAAVVVTVGGLYLKGDLTWGDPLALAPVVFLGSQGVYHLLNAQLDALTKATDLRPRPAPITQDDLDRFAAEMDAKLKGSAPAPSVPSVLDGPGGAA